MQKASPDQGPSVPPGSRHLVLLWNAAGGFITEVARDQIEMQQMVDQGIHWSVQTVKNIEDVFKTTPLVDVKTEDDTEVAPLMQGNGAVVNQPAPKACARQFGARGAKASNTYTWGDRTFVKDIEPHIVGAPHLASPVKPVRDSAYAAPPPFGEVPSRRSGAEIAARRNSSVAHQVNSARLLKQHASAVRLEKGARVQKCGASLSSPSRPCSTQSHYRDNDNGRMR